VWTAAGGSLPAKDAGRLADEYRNMLRQIGPSALRVVDKNPFNFFWIGLIRMVPPRARIILCERDPVDTCVSIHTTHFSGAIPFVSDLDDLVFFYRQYQRLMATLTGRAERRPLHRGAIRGSDRRSNGGNA
jgi:hypothetical protein